MLQLCTSQQINTTPYTFRATGTRVYTIEEVLYYAYHNWRDLHGELSSAKLVAWVKSIGHPAISAKITAIAKFEPLSRQVMAFLSIIEYFDAKELSRIESELKSWEHRVEWERLKDRADHLVSRNDPARAISLYDRALKYEENPLLHNNAAIAHMKLGNHREAMALLAKAHTRTPENTAILHNYAEAAILASQYETAAKLLHKAETTPGEPSITPIPNPTSYLRGLMSYQQADYPTAETWFQKAKSENHLRAAHMLANTYIKLHQHDKALAVLPPTDHEKRAEIYAAQGHAHSHKAISHMKEAIAQNPENANLWTKLARLYRQDYDNPRANEAIQNALPSQTSAALLENARIKKGLGRMREYQAGLSEVVKRLKEGYRVGE